MRNFILTTLILGCFSIHSASARVLTIEDFRGEFLDVLHNTSAAATCEEHGGVLEKPAHMVCDEGSINGITCYTNCECAPEFNKSCSGTGEKGSGDTCNGYYATCTCKDEYQVCGGVSVGTGDACTADGGNKYTDCECPANYNQACTGTGEIGVGNACDSRYTACKCNAYYQKSCAAAAGDGEPCTADGANKYASCDWGQYDGVSCRAVTDATPYYNSAEYIQHANAFQGIENTKALIESQGAAALPAYAAVNFHPPYCVSAGHEYLGIGNWYLPSAGEMLYLSGTDFNNMSSLDDGSAITDTNYTVVNNALITAWHKGGSTGKWVQPFWGQSSHTYSDYGSSAPDTWTSSKSWDHYPYYWVPSKANYTVYPNYPTSGVYPQYIYAKKNSQGYNANITYNKHMTRPVLMLQNCFNNANIAVGSVLFSDMTVGSADTATPKGECSKKFPVGVVYWVSPDKTLVRVISTKVATFKSGFSVDPNDPSGHSGSDYLYRTPWIYPANSDYNSGDIDIAAMTEDAWGCTSIDAENPDCSNEPKRHKAMTCTPDDGSAEYTAHSNAFKGKEYTDAILAQHGNKADAAYQASQFYARQNQYNDYKDAFKTNSFIGQGKWYLPSAGEMLYLNGVNFNSMSGITDAVGVGSNLSAIETTLGYIAAYSQDGKVDYPGATTSNTPSYWGARCSTFAAQSPRVWTSSEVDAENAYYFDSTDGTIKIANKKNPEVQIRVRPVTMLHNFGFVGYNPQVGDVLNSNMSIGRASPNGSLPAYFNSGTSYSIVFPIGIIYWVSPDKSTIRVVSCRRYYDANGVGDSMKWLKSGTAVDIKDIPNEAWRSITCDVNWDSILFNGKANTAAIVAAIGEHGLAAYATNQFYPLNVAADNADFGQGQWYLPSSGEAMLLSGAEFEYIGSSVNSAFNGGQTKTIINEALTTLSGKSIVTEGLFKTAWDWTSSIVSDSVAYCNNASNRAQVSKWDSHGVRPVLLLENKLAVGAKIGDVVYSNLTYGSADDFVNDGSKIPVGIVYWVSDDGNKVRVVNLKYLRFSNQASTGNFNPATPFTGTANSTDWADSTATYTPIPGVTLITSAKPADLCNAVTPCE